MNTSEKLLIGAAVSLFFLTYLPSIFVLAKVAIGLAMLSLGMVAFKVTLKATLNTLEQSEIYKNHTIRNKIINITIGLMSLLIGGLSSLIMAKTGLTAVCAAFAALVLHKYVKVEEKEVAKRSKFEEKTDDEFVDMGEESNHAQDKEKNGCINEKFDKIADNIVKHTSSFIISSIEKLTPSQSRQV